MNEQYEDEIARRQASGPQLCGICNHALHTNACWKPHHDDPAQRCPCKRGIRTDAYLNYQFGKLIESQHAITGLLVQLIELTGVATNLQVVVDDKGNVTIVPRSNLVKP